MNAHSVFSPSASHRILMCPPSMMLCAKEADESSAYAQEGTDAHSLCAYLVEKELGRDAEDPTAGLEYVCGDFYQRFIETNYDLTPSGIIKYLRLKKMDYNLVSSCGHFGFTPAPWELDEETVNRVYGEIED